VDLTEFAINASISATTGYAPFELNGGHMPSMIREIRSDEAIPKGIKDFANQALQNLADAHNAIIESRVFQAKNANTKHSEEPKIKAGDLVYLLTRNLNLPKGWAQKLCPKYVGPYKVLQAKPESSNYMLELPTALQERRIHPTFHVSLLRPYQASNDALFLDRVHPEPYDFGAPDDSEWFVDELLGHHWDGRQLEFQVRWSLGDTTWEPSASCKDLSALDRYLELQGVQHPAQLSRRSWGTGLIESRRSWGAGLNTVPHTRCLTQGTIEFLVGMVNGKQVSVYSSAVRERSRGLCTLTDGKNFCQVLHTATDQCHRNTQEMVTEEAAPASNHQARTSEALKGGEEVRLTHLHWMNNDDATGLYKQGHQGMNSLPKWGRWDVREVHITSPSSSSYSHHLGPFLGPYPIKGVTFTPLNTHNNRNQRNEDLQWVTL